MSQEIPAKAPASRSKILDALAALRDWVRSRIDMLLKPSATSEPRAAQTKRRRSTTFDAVESAPAGFEIERMVVALAGKLKLLGESGSLETLRKAFRACQDAKSLSPLEKVLTDWPTYFSRSATWGKITGGFEGLSARGTGDDYDVSVREYLAERNGFPDGMVSALQKFDLLMDAALARYRSESADRLAA